MSSITNFDFVFPSLFLCVALSCIHTDASALGSAVSSPVIMLHVVGIRREGLREGHVVGMRERG